MLLQRRQRLLGVSARGVVLLCFLLVLFDVLLVVRDHVLRELASVSVEEGARLRVLFIVPEMTGSQFASVIEEARLPDEVKRLAQNTPPSAA